MQRGIFSPYCQSDFHDWKAWKIIGTHPLYSIEIVIFHEWNCDVVSLSPPWSKFVAVATSLSPRAPTTISRRTKWSLQVRIWSDTGKPIRSNSQTKNGISESHFVGASAWAFPFTFSQHLAKNDKQWCLLSLLVSLPWGSWHYLASHTFWEAK